MKNVLMKRPNKTWESDQPKKDNWAIWIVTVASIAQWGKLIFNQYGMEVQNQAMNTKYIVLIINVKF